MHSNNPAEPQNIATVAILSLALISATLSGCAADRSQNPLASLYQPPGSSMEQARKEIFEKGPKPTIQQTSFESAVPDQKWQDSLTGAIQEAQSNDKLILANFTGSDWCHFCVKLKDEVFSAPEFKQWASENVVLLEVDSPKRSQLPKAIHDQNEMLKSRFNITSFPTVLLLDVNGNVLAKMGYERGKSPSQWVQLVESRLQNSASSKGSIANGQGSGKLLR